MKPTYHEYKIPIERILWQCAIMILAAQFPFFSFAQKIPPSYFRTLADSRLQEGVDSYYQLADSQYLWHNSGEIPVLLKHIRQARQAGISILIDSSDHVAALTKEDSLLQDMQLTKAALGLMISLQCGSRKPSFGNEGLPFECRLPSSGRLLRDALLSKNLNATLQKLNPHSPEYEGLKKMLNQLLNITQSPAFSDIVVRKPKTKSDSIRIIQRLAQLQLIDDKSDYTDSALFQNAIKKTQLMFDLEPDGKIGKRTLNAINIPLSTRIRELEASLDFIRWSGELRKKEMTLILNIPAARLWTYQNGNIVLESKVIVGKPSTPTPMLTGIIDELVLYPFWMVPHKIATREMLPEIRKDIRYLERGNYQVLNRQGRIVNPYSINWQGLSTSYFPFVIRQSTGCDNALGTVKFDFDNPFAVYLHDTPGKELFARRSRFFSHGCMRLEKPVELAHLLLEHNRIAIDTLTEKGCLLQQKPISVKAERKAGLIVHYNTAWFDNQAGVIFYSDIYSRFRKVR